MSLSGLANTAPPPGQCSSSSAASWLTKVGARVRRQPASLNEAPGSFLARAAAGRAQTPAAAVFRLLVRPKTASTSATRV